MSSANYQTISGSYNDTIGNGDVLENLLIDANGANVTINLIDGGTIRSVAIIDHGASPAAITVNCRDGGNAIIDGCYLIGAADNHCFASANHSGHCEVRNTFFGESVEDSTYFSPPSNPDTSKWQQNTQKDRGQGGSFLINKCYSINANDYAFRLGVGRILNSRVVNAGVALASLYRSIVIEGTHVANSNVTLRVGDQNPNNAANANQRAKAILRGDVQFTGGTSRYDLNTMAPGPSIVEGTPGSNPTSTIQPGIPTSPEQAASGESQATPTPAPGGGGDDDGPSSPTPTPTPTSPTAPTRTPCRLVKTGTLIGGTPDSGGGAGGGGTPGSGGGSGGAPLPSGVGDIGGGASYTDIYSAADADTVVPANDGPALGDAIEGASPGEVIYLEGGRYVIDRIRLQTDGITIAGDRGSTAGATTSSLVADGGQILDGGAPGPIIAARGVEARPIIAKASNFLITGIRFEGPDTTWNGEAGSNDHHPVGIDHKGGEGMTVANCEGYGWEAIFVGARADGPDHIHHCHIHDNPGASMGYGVQSGPSNGQTLIEKNYFANCRHEIAADPQNAGYVVRYNIFAPSYYNHAVDQHGAGGPGARAGGNLHIYNNTFLGTDAETQESIRVRGTPTERCLIEKNSFRMTRMDVVIRQSAEPKYSNGNVFASAADPSGFRNMVVTPDNYFGPGQPPVGVGAFADSGATASAAVFARQVA